MNAWFRTTMAIGVMGAWAGMSQADGLQKPDPGKKIRVFVFAGQSNMEGRADGTKLSEADKERLTRAQARVQLAYNGEPVKPLDVSAPSREIHGLYHIDLTFGPELFFGLAMAEALPEEKMLFIKRTAGGTSLYGCWNPDWSEEKASLMGEEKKPKLYGEMIEYVRKVLSGYKPDEYELCAMFWVQGETDSPKKEAAEAYGANLRRLIEQARKDLGRDDLPFLLLQLGSDQVKEGMKETARDVKNVSLLTQSQDPGSPEFLPKIPNGHYDGEGLKRIGERFAKTYLETYSKSGESG